MMRVVRTATVAREYGGGAGSCGKVGDCGGSGEAVRVLLLIPGESALPWAVRLLPSGNACAGTHSADIVAFPTKPVLFPETTDN